MKLLTTEITPLINDFMYVDLRSQPFLASPYHSQPSFHAHPEMELVFVIEGFGKRIIGNKVEMFEPGDMVFMGSNVPHIWLSDVSFYEGNSGLQSKVIVTYFNANIIQQIFESIKEFSQIREMIKQSSKGIKILGKTRAQIAATLIDISNKTGFDKIQGLLKIMHLISTSEEKTFIANSDNIGIETADSDRLIDVIKYMKENLHEHISLKQVASIAYMKEQSFCRYFKNRTTKSFSQYLEELRIEHARKLLIEKDKKISDIAFACGFSSTSHFCKVFKDHNNQSPLQYRSYIRKGLAD